MSDRELLELAAKAAGIDLSECHFRFGAFRREETHEKLGFRWNPLTDDGDALRLAVKLQLTICNEHIQAGVAYCTRGDSETYPDELGAVNGESEVLPDDYLATRRAIVRAAAEIGRRMP